MKIAVDKRLEAILAHINAGDSVADIGADHGKIAVLAALKTGRTTVASDISGQSLKKAEKLAAEYGVKNLQFRLGDGLEILKEGESDTAVIAGMGGREVIKIISKRPFALKKYILVAHTEVRELRAYLAASGFAIQSDSTVKSGGRFYSVILAREGGESRVLNGRELRYGLDYGGDFKLYRERELKKLAALIEKTSGGRQAEFIKDASILKELGDDHS